MEIKLYNTLTRKIEEFKPLKPGGVGMYTCGITAYDHTTFGHMRTYVNTDLLRRMLGYNGLEVKQVENVTDVGHLVGDGDMCEDKLEVGAKREGESAWEIAKKYEKEFFQAMESLNVKKPTVVCRATEHIKEMIDLVKRIEKNGYTYRTSDGVYFDTLKIKNYNELSGMPLEKLKEGARVEKNLEKKNPTDFALWKFSPKTGPKRQMEWDSPWGKGFPGWHIECSAMGLKYLGDGEHCRTIDIHTGGEDHINVHHTNERAQNIAATGHPVVNFWFHNIFLTIEGKRMSKSAKNFYWLKDLKDRKIDPLSLRYLFLMAHYRSRMNFTWRSLKSAQVAYKKLIEMIRAWYQDGRKTVSVEDVTKIDQLRTKFVDKINYDLNIPEALTVVWEVTKSDIPAPDKLDLILDFDQVLGLRLAEVSRKTIKIPEKINLLIAKREKLRQSGKWQQADEIRQEVEKLGWQIQDTAKGVKVKPLKQ